MGASLAEAEAANGYFLLSAWNMCLILCSWALTQLLRDASTQFVMLKEGNS
jgi:hypothetical protein